jgi:hypothetical protein
MRAKWIRRTAFALCISALATLLSLGVWVATYPDAGDPKNIRYVLWTHGLNKNMNLEDAVGTMTHDRRPERLVLGLSEAQLASRFGYVKQISEDPPHSYYRRCYTEYSGYRGGTTAGEKAIILRDSWWMVILKNGVAVDLVLCKG